MRMISFRPVAALAAALGLSVAGMSPAASLIGLRPNAVIIPERKRRNKSKRVRTRTGWFYPFSSTRQQRREARLAAKMRATRTMNDDMLVRHRPKNSGPGMDMLLLSRQVRRAEQRRDAKTRASRMKEARVPANWRQFIDLDKATSAARAAG